MTDLNRGYIPAAGRHWRLPFYDLLARLLGADHGRKVLADQVPCIAGARILEIGCGTGETLLLLKRACPDVDVVGLDPDLDALDLARRKLSRAHLRVRLDRGFAEELPYADRSFDAVVSSLMFHHLAPGAKERALMEVVRVLRPGGQFDMLDLAEPPGGGFLSRRIGLARHLKDNDEGRVLQAMREAGLVEAGVAGRLAQRFSMVCYRAYAPGDASNGF